MLRGKLVPGYLLLCAVCFGPSARAELFHVDANIHLLDVLNDAEPEIRCTLDVVETASGEFDGLYYACDGSRKVERKITLEDLKKGTDLQTYNGNTVISVSSKELAQDGGWVEWKFLVNYITGSTDVFPMEMKKVGKTWAAYTDDKLGRRQFKKATFKKNTVFGTVVGFEEIVVE